MDKINEDLLNEDVLVLWKKRELEKWLVQRNLKKTGTKQVLIHRIIRSLRFDCSSDSDIDTDSDYGEDSSHIPNIKSLKSNWESITTNLCPPTRTEDVENYFIYNKNPITGKTQGCRRQLKKAKKFCKERYIYDIMYNGMEDSDYCYIQSKCKPSMKDKITLENGKSARHYTLNVLLVKKTGKIEGGECNCKPGLTGLCSHIGGLLLSLVEIKNPCTTKICEWVKPQKELRLQPARLSDINFSSNDDVPTKPFPNTYSAGPCKDPDIFFKDIMSRLGYCCPNSVLFKTLNSEATDLTDILAKYQPEFSFCDNVDLNSTVCQSTFRTFLQEIDLSSEEVETIEKPTKGQSVNPAWKEMRTCILTASNFGAVCKKRDSTEPENLISKLRGYTDFDSKPLQYGRKKESQARRDYAKYHLKKCGNVSVSTVGLSVSKEFPFLGASVDGIIKCEICGVGSLEIKCPYVGRNVTPAEYASMKSSCVNSADMSLKCNHDYMYQVMGQMKVVGADWCDFVVWTKKGLHVERINFSEEFWTTKMLANLKLFYTSTLLAEVFSSRVKRGKKLFD